MNQLNIQLNRGFDRRATPLSSIYRTTRQGLQETIANSYFIYGRWDKLFGCWHIRKQISPFTQREILPDWPILIQPKERQNASRMSVLAHQNPYPDRNVVLGHRANYSFASFLNSIPSLIQDLCRPFDRMQWLALDICHQIPGFYRFIHEERRAGRTGYMAAVFAALHNSGSCNRMERRETGLRIISAKRRDVLAEGFQQPISKSAVRLIERLPENLSFETVLQLLDALKDPDAAKAMRHAEQVTVDLIEALMCLPAEFCHPNISMLVADGVSSSYLDHTIYQSVRFLTNKQRRIASSEFKKINSGTILTNWGHKWTKQGRLNTPFPSPPLKSYLPLVPIASYSALKAEGRSMHNCVETFWQDVLDGHLFFYHWAGDEPASVSVVSTPDGHWQIQEALGFRNQSLTAKTQDQIQSHIEIDQQIN